MSLIHKTWAHDLNILKGLSYGNVLYIHHGQALFKMIKSDGKNFYIVTKKTLIFFN